MSAPYYVDESITLLHGHVADVLPTLAAGSVDCCVTSPPYYGLRDYGVDGQLGLEPSPAEYVEAMRATFAEVRRVLADDGVLWLNLGDSYSGSWGNQGRKEERGTQRPVNGPMMQPVHDGRYPTTGSNTGAIKLGQPPAKNMFGIPWRVAFALQDDGWILRNAVIWAKPNAMPESVTDRLSTRYEHVFLFSKSRRYWFDLDPIRTAPGEGRNPPATVPRKYAHLQSGKGSINQDGWTVAPVNPGDVWTIPTSPFPGAHFAVMPRELARRCIASGCKPGGTVLDPFSGSGTTGLAATSLGRKYIGIDLSAEYLDLSLRTRLAQTAFMDGDAS